MGINWEYLGKEALPPGTVFPAKIETWRAPVPGGWLVLTIVMNTDGGTHSTTFYPDPQHEWDGGSV